MDHNPPSTADYAASDARAALDRLKIVEARLAALYAMLIPENGVPMTRAEFEKRWVDCVPPTVVHEPADWSRFERKYHEDLNRRYLGRARLLGDDQ